MMPIKQDKCLNCGASIDYSKVYNGVYKCPFCRENYHIDDYGMVEEYKVKIKWMGKTIYCYLGSTSVEYPIYNDYRSLDGTMAYIKREPELKFELISYKIEE